MLTFNELRIDDAKTLIVDASVLDITADPDRTIAIDTIRVGYGTNVDTIDYYVQTFYDTNYFTNLYYSQPEGYYTYKYVFTTISSVSVGLGSEYVGTSTGDTNEHTFRVIDNELDENDNTVRYITCLCDDNITVSSSPLVKVSGIGDDTISFTACSSSTQVRKKFLRGFRLEIPLTNPAIINTLGNVANTLIYIKVGVTVPADVWEELGTCSDIREIEGYTYDRCLIVNNVFDYLKELENPCASISNLANYITQINGLQVAVESNKFTLANKYWTKFFANNRSIGSTNNTCHCCH